MCCVCSLEYPLVMKAACTYTVDNMAESHRPYVTEVIEDRQQRILLWCFLLYKSQ